MRCRILATLTAVLLVVTPAVVAQGKASGTKGSPKEKPRTTGKSANADKGKAEKPDTSNQGGETRGRERALEAQKHGKGAEKRGFDTPKGLSGDKGKDKEKDKDKSKDKEGKDRDKAMEQAKGKNPAKAGQAEAREKEAAGKARKEAAAKKQRR
jgi:hypothetical protein